MFSYEIDRIMKERSYYIDSETYLRIIRMIILLRSGRMRVETGNLASTERMGNNGNQTLCG